MHPKNSPDLGARRGQFSSWGQIIFPGIYWVIWFYITKNNLVFSDRGVASHQKLWILFQLQAAVKKICQTRMWYVYLIFRIVQLKFVSSISIAYRYRTNMSSFSCNGEFINNHKGTWNPRLAKYCLLSTVFSKFEIFYISCVSPAILFVILLQWVISSLMLVLLKVLVLAVKSFINRVRN